MDKLRKISKRQICIKCKKPTCAEHSICQTKCENCYVGASHHYRNNKKYMDYIVVEK